MFKDVNYYKEPFPNKLSIPYGYKSGLGAMLVERAKLDREREKKSAWCILHPKK